MSEPTCFPWSINAERFPGADAIRWGGRTISWELLDTYIHSTARHLKELGVKSASRIAFLAEPSVSSVIVLMSLWKVGALVCPLNPRLPDVALTEVLALFSPELLITDQERPSAYRSVLVSDLVTLETVEKFLGSQSQNTFNLDQEAVAILTGGSSGRHKLALLTFRNLLSSAKAANSMVPFRVNDAWLLSLPVYHVSGLGIIFRSFIEGGTIAISSNNDLAGSIREMRPTHISLVPTQFLKLLDDQKTIEFFRYMKCILVGGGPIPERVVAVSKDLKLQTYLTYGLTEMASQVATVSVKDAFIDEDGTKTIHAKILPGCEVMKSDDGEVLVRGEMLFKGYLDKGEAKPVFTDDGWYPTGDIGVIKKGRLKISGRKDNMFICGGENIFPEAIEKIFMNHKGIVDVVVSSKEDAVYGRVPVAFLRIHSGIGFDRHELIKFLRSRLLHFEVPREFYDWPKTTEVGVKVNRSIFSKLIEEGGAEPMLF